MLPKIGITTEFIRHAKWYKHIEGLGFDTIEINRQNSKLYFNLYFLEKVRRYTRGYDLSIHSATKGIFHKHRNFTKANLTALIAEVDQCEILGAKQVVFHLNGGILARNDKQRLQEIIDYAKQFNVRMMYESDAGMSAHVVYDVLESFGDLGYVLDLGHLNYSVGNGTLGCSMEEFIHNVKDRVEYIHASNNWGTRDEHNSLAEGTLDWCYVLDLLDLSRVIKIIIEVRTIEMVGSTYSDMVQYMEARYRQYHSLRVEK